MTRPPPYEMSDNRPAPRILVLSHPQTLRCGLSYVFVTSRVLARFRVTTRVDVLRTPRG